METHISLHPPLPRCSECVTMVASCVGIFRATTLLRAWEGEALFEAFIVVLVLGVLLWIRGPCLAFRGFKYGSGSHAAGNQPPPSVSAHCSVRHSWRGSGANSCGRLKPVRPFHTGPGRGVGVTGSKCLGRRRLSRALGQGSRFVRGAKHLGSPPAVV